MRDMAEREYTRQPGFMHVFSEETARMQSSPSPPPDAAKPRPTAPDTAQDTAVLLPILLLLLREGADRWLLLALAYILL